MDTLMSSVTTVTNAAANMIPTPVTSGANDQDVDCQTTSFDILQHPLFSGILMELRHSRREQQKREDKRDEEWKKAEQERKRDQEELKKDQKERKRDSAFKELREKLQYVSQKVKWVEMQIDTHRRTKQHNALIKQELQEIPKGVNTYEALGRAFVLTPREVVFQNLDKVNSETEQKITILENSKQYLEGNLKASENNLREMVQRKREVGHKENKPGSSKA